jgi:periplasmic protein TonB
MLLRKGISGTVVTIAGWFLFARAFDARKFISRRVRKVGRDRRREVERLQLKGRICHQNFAGFGYPRPRLAPENREEFEMFDQLVESKSNADVNARRSSFLLTTFVIMSTILVSAYLVSLFAKDYGMGGSELSLDTLVAPPVIEEAPEPEPEKQPEKQKDPNVDVRKEIIQSMAESPKPPKEISVAKQTIPPRDPNRYTVKGNINFSAENAPPPDYKGPVNVAGQGSSSGLPGGGGREEKRSAPPPPPATKPPPKQISQGVLNGRAIALPKPAYPPAARAIRASGQVQVQVLIDESGNVVSASAVSGHALLRPAAVGAARGAKFSPTLLSGQPVRVSGIITYNFVAP